MTQKTYAEQMAEQEYLKRTALAIPAESDLNHEKLNPIFTLLYVLGVGVTALWFVLHLIRLI